MYDYLKDIDDVETLHDMVDDHTCAVIMGACSWNQDYVDALNARLQELDA